MHRGLGLRGGGGRRHAQGARATWLWWEGTCTGGGARARGLHGGGGRRHAQGVVVGGDMHRGLGLHGSCGRRHAQGARATWWWWEETCTGG